MTSPLVKTALPAPVAGAGRARLIARRTPRLAKAAKDALRARAAATGENFEALVRAAANDAHAAAKAVRARQRRAAIYRLRLNADERQALTVAAAARCMTPAALLRSAFPAPSRGSEAGAPDGMPPAAGLDPAALAQLARIGSNLNQLARRANSGDLLQPGELPETLTDLRAALARIETLVFNHVE